LRQRVIFCYAYFADCYLYLPRILSKNILIHPTAHNWKLG